MLHATWYIVSDHDSVFSSDGTHFDLNNLTAMHRSDFDRTDNLDMISDTCQFWVECSGFKRGDVTIPAGKLFFAVPAWGGKLSRKGLVTVRQRR